MAQQITPWHEMPTIRRDDIIRHKATHAGDLEIVRECGRALDGDAAALDAVGRRIRREWRDAEIAAQQDD